MLTYHCLPLCLAALSLLGVLCGHASAVVPPHRQPGYRPQPNAPDDLASRRDSQPLAPPQRTRSPDPDPLHPAPDHPRLPQQQQHAAPTRQPQYRQQQQQQLLPQQELQQQQQYRQQHLQQQPQEQQYQQQQQQQQRLRPENLSAGNQRSAGRQEPFQSDHGARLAGEGPSRRVDPPAPQPGAGQSRHQPQQQPQSGTGPGGAGGAGGGGGGRDRPLTFQQRPPREEESRERLDKQKELELAYRLQVERRQREQEASRRRHEAFEKEQEAIRRQRAEEMERQFQEQNARLRRERAQRQQQQQQQQAGSAARDDPRRLSDGRPSAADVAAHHDHRAEETRRRDFADASADRARPVGVGGGGMTFDTHDDNTNNNVRNNNNNNNNNARNNVHATNSNEDDVPDAPHGAGTNIKNNNNNKDNGMSDDFRRGLIRKVYKEEEETDRGGGGRGGGGDGGSRDTLASFQRHAYPPEQPLRHLGGMSISWDWDDFSMSFQNYGVAEMKVRRAPHATTGEPWPLPQYYTKKAKNILLVDPGFQLVLSNNITCDIVEQALERYRRRILEHAMEDMYDNLQNAEGTGVEVPEDKYMTPLYRDAPTLHRFSLKIRRPCSAFPALDSDESYDLVVKKTSSYLWANEVWGLLRGLETLSQLIWKGPDDRLYVKESVISDYPRFPHRGILIDSSRHFIFKEVIFDMMDAMEMNKMNVLHWHIVDDQSFPYQSKVFPELSAKGAYHPTFVYSLSDIAEIIDYGRMRGIRILPEFDSPGHTYSWGLSRPELLTQCYAGSSAVRGYLGPIDPVKNSTYRFLRSLFGEILHVFKDEYMHLGGDEVPLGCWQSNPEVVKFGRMLNQEDSHGQENDQAYFGEASPSIRKVYEYYVNRVMKDLKDMGKARDGIKFIMWQEVMNNNLKLPNDTLIQVWMGDMADVNRAIGMGYDVLYSSCWYLDHVEYGVKWPKYYQCDPADASYGYRIDEKKVKGGEACLWSEYIDNENLIQTTWPRSSAVAERLWSSKDTKNLDAAGERLSEHRCRMLKRGLSVGQISGPDYCLRSGVNQGRLREPRKKCEGGRCQGEVVPDPVETHSDIKFRVRTEGGGTADCSWWQVFLQSTLLQMGSHVTALLLLLLVAFLLLFSLSRSSGKLYALRMCRHRTILLFFFAVLFIYFMCYTTMWMHVFEFSGSFQHKRHMT